MTAYDCLQRAFARATEAGILIQVEQEILRQLRVPEGGGVNLQQLLGAAFGGAPLDQTTADYLTDVVEGVLAAEDLIKERSRRLQLQALTQIRLARRFRVLENTKVDGRVIMRSFLTFDWGGKVRGETLNYSHARQTARNDLAKHVAEMIARQGNKEFEPGSVFSNDVVDEIFGQSSGNPDAALMARAFESMFEAARQRLNAAGAWVAKLDRYWPQSSDAALMDAVGKDEWIRFMLEDIDIDWDALARVTTPEGERTRLLNREEFLSNYYDDVVDNRNTIAPITGKPMMGQERMPKSFVESIGTARYLHFADADSWRRYHERFGSAQDVPTVIHSWIDKTAKQIAALEMFGPDPDSTVNALLWRMKQHDLVRAKQLPPGRKRRDALKQAQSGEAGAQFRNMWADMRGTATVSERASRGTLGSNIRQYGTGALLGSAIFLALTDLVPMAFAARIAGIPAANVFLKQITGFAGGIFSFKDRQEALRRGWTSEIGHAAVLDMARWNNEVHGSKWARGFSEFILRKSGMITHTEVARAVYSTEFAGKITQELGTDWNALPKQFKTMLERHGLTRADWKLAQKVGPSTMDNGAEFLTPADFMRDVPAGADMLDIKYRARRETANKFQQMVSAETMRAVPTPDERVRAILTAGTKPGTFTGEAVRSVAFLKTFPMTIATIQLLSLVSDERLFGGVPSRIAHGAAFAVLMTLFAAGGITLRDMSRGKTPPSWDPSTEEGRRFWFNALTQSGTFAWMGDAVLSSTERGYVGTMEYLAGPLATAALRIADGVVTGAESDDPVETVLDKEWRVLQQFAPGRTLWWATLGYERLVLDQITKVLAKDPDKIFDKRRRRAEDLGQRFIWEPGELTP